MKAFFGSVAIGAVIAVASVAPSSAAVIADYGTVNLLPSSNLGTLTPKSIDDSANYSFKTTGPFSQTFDFVLSTASKLALSFTASYADSSQIINPFNVALYNGAGASGSQIAAGSGTVFPDRVGGGLTEFLAAGSYSFNLNGTSGDFPSVGGTLTVSSVPLPASAPMFGAALLGLAGLGYAAKRKKAAASAA